MPERMAAERIAAQENSVDGEHERTRPDAEGFSASSRVDKPHGFPGVIGQNEDEQYGEVEKVPVNVWSIRVKEFSPRYVLRGSPTAQAGGSAQNDL